MPDQWLLRLMQVAPVFQSCEYDAGQGRRVGDLVTQCASVVSCSEDTNGLRMRFSNGGVIEDAYKADVIKFANAMYVSIAAAERSAKTSSDRPWAYISLYYAGFFAAHLLLRHGGCAIIGLKAGEAQALASSVKDLGVATFTGFGNTAKCQCALDTNSILVVAASRPAHDILWSTFSERIDAFADSLNKAGLTSSQKGGLGRFSMKLKSRLKGEYSAESLAASRNAVNYRFEKGLWFPSSYQGGFVEYFKIGWQNPDCLADSVYKSAMEEELTVLGALCGTAHLLLSRYEELGGGFGQAISSGPTRLHREQLRKRFP